MIDLTEEERHAALSFWAGLVSFFALFYLTGSFLKAVVVGIFVLVSCLLGLGQRWLFEGIVCDRNCSHRGRTGRPKPKSMGAVVAVRATDALRRNVWLSIR
jgi:uncharacterized membrane protein